MKTIGFIGAGNMATAIIGGLLKSKVIDGSHILVYDVLTDKLQKMADDMGITACETASQAASADITVLAVKPQNYAEVLESIKDAISADKVIVTIAAGISTEYIASAIGHDCSMVRVMPNTPLLLGMGATALCRHNISDEDFEFVYNMFANSGVVAVLDEAQMNSVIAVNGSSPAYIYLFAKAMIDYAVKEGISEDAAVKLVCASLKGSAEMIERSGDTPETLIKKVSSPGGTTLKALEKLNEHNFYESIMEAMDACTKRAEELSK